MSIHSLRLGTTLLLLSALPLQACKSSSGTDASDDGDEGCFSLLDGSCVVETYVDPPTATPDENGVYTLTLDASEVTIAGQRHCVRTYNGSYGGPIIDTPAREGTQERQVRINLANKLKGHAYKSLKGEQCTCETSDGAACTPAHIHNSCASGPDDCTCVNEDGEACEGLFDFNVTNLHAHGSHIRPDWSRGGEPCEPTTMDGTTFDCRDCDEDVCDGSGADNSCYHGDNVLNAVHPGEGAQYRWDIDEDGTHHTGLQWYHPHIHGTTAIQVASGAAGPWIVRGELDALPGIVDARERVLVFSTPSIATESGFEPLKEGETCSESTITFDDFLTLSSTSVPQLDVINGVHKPRMVTAPEQVERWRILHAGYLDEVFLGLFRGMDSDCEQFSTASEDTIRLTQIGRDGLILPQPFEHDYIFMSPGYRVEAMLGGAGTLADGETWCLVAARFLQDSTTPGDPFNEQPHAPDGEIEPSDVFARFSSDGEVVAILNVAQSYGEATTKTLPDYAAVGELAPSLTLDGVPAEERCATAAAITAPEDIDQAAVLQVGFWTLDDPDPCGCEPYNVNCHNFEYTDRTKRPFDRDMPLDAVEHWRIAASTDGHPFHIHINPYIACPSDDEVFDPLPFPHWRDTYLVNLDRKIDILTQNKSYTGSFVFHCHKLTHEDDGMMQLIRVCDPSEDATCGDYGWRSCPVDDLECIQALAATDCALTAPNQVAAGACVMSLGGPNGVCGANACVNSSECAPPGSCVDNVCVLP